MSKKGKTKIRIIVVALILVILLFVLLANFITDLLWFNEVGYESVFLTKIITQFAIGIPSFLIIGALALLFLKTFKKSYYKRMESGDGKSTEKSSGWIVLGLSAAVALFITLFFTVPTWFEALKFIDSTSFGIADPLFHMDISFYVFRLEMIERLNTIAFALIVGFAVISFVYFKVLFSRNPPAYAQADNDSGNNKDESGSGGFAQGSMFEGIFENIRKMAAGDSSYSPRPRPTSKDGTIRELIEAAPNQAVILGVLFCLAIGAKFFIMQFDLLYSTTGTLHGAGYRDVNVTLLVYRILAGLAVLSAAGVIVATKKKRLKFILAAPVVMIAVGIIGTVAGFVVQNYVVSSDEINLDGQYIARNIEFTQYAYGLNNVSVRDFPVSNTLTREDLDNNYQTISNIRLNDDEPVRRFYNNIQTIRPYYVFTDVYVDRYMINGEFTQAYIAAREIEDTSRSPIPQTFLNSHIKYTHGYGITLSRVDRISESGLPEMLIRNIPPESDVAEINITRPEIYFGRMTNEYILVNTTEPAFDYPIGSSDDGRNAEAFYNGDAGIRLNFLNRLLFSIREGNLRILVSGALTNESGIVINRNVMQRVRTIMPWLSYDSEPYMVTADGRLFWVIDAYTTSAYFPYSEPFAESANYIRNSVKIVIDAFHGTTNFYIVDPTDPIAATYRKIYPSLFKDISQIDEMSAELKNHLRYPNMLLNIQANMYRRYHMSDVTMFYQNEDLWDIATEIFGATEQRMVSNYYVMKLPGEDKAEFVNTIPFTPRGRRNMSALILARNDGDHYGELVLFRLPKGRQIPGPMQVDAQIEQDGKIAQDLALWSQSGSIVNRGNMFIVPIENTFLYVKPIYLEAETGSIPEVRRVVVAYGAPDRDGVRIAYQPTLDAALEELFGPSSVTGGQTPGTPAGPGTPQRPDVTPPETGSSTVAELIALMAEAFESAQAAQRNGDWSAYGLYLAQMESYLNQLQELTQ